MNVDDLKKKLEELEKSLADPQIFNSPEKSTEIQKEYQKIKKQIEQLEKLNRVNFNITETEKMLKETEDDELRVLAENELENLKTERIKIKKEINKNNNGDNNDEKNVIVEIRAGTGGDEAALFAFDLQRMYSRYAEKNGWQQEILSSNRTGLNGLKEIIFRLAGKNVWQHLKNEAGVHRVQRVPLTEKSGRVHTSTASVAILPEATETELKINPGDLKIDTYRASGHGGQNVQKIESAIRITHLPTNLVVSCQEERSQSRNKEKALRVLRTRLLIVEKERKAKELGQARKEQIKKAERADKIRTYNFPQNRITDHRINKSWHNITQTMDGDLNKIIESFNE